MSVTVIAKITPQPEHRDAVKAALLEVIPAVHSEPGCELYSLHEAPEGFVMVEKWASVEDLGVHGKAPALTGLTEKIGTLLAGPLEVTVANPIPAGDADRGAL